MNKEILRPFTEEDLRRKDANVENIARAVAYSSNLDLEKAKEVVRSAIAEVNAEKELIEAESWTEMNELLNNVARR